MEGARVEVGWCFESSQPQRIISGLKANLGLSPGVRVRTGCINCSYSYS